VTVERQILGQEKTCTKCGYPKDLSEFYEHESYKDGRYSWCIQCFKERKNANYNPARAKTLKYGIDFNALWQKQQGLCALCGNLMLPRGVGPTSVVVDHDHGCCPGLRSCGECVRGLIHKRCNMVIGVATDNPEILKRAAAYLNRWRETLT
jgi:Recombination endonuclease VII